MDGKQLAVLAGENPAINGNGSICMQFRLSAGPRRGPAGKVATAASLCLSVALALGPNSAASADAQTDAIAQPLRIFNMSPFHVPYSTPASFGVRTMPPGSYEVHTSLDMASYLSEVTAESEQALLDGETYRTGFALRAGFRDRWEYFLELSAIGHHGGRFDTFIETWHDVFGLPQGDRDITRRNRLAIVYGNADGEQVGIRKSETSLADLGIGAGYSVPDWPIQNDGLTVRAMVRLPTGDDRSLAGSDGLSASVWAETSGALPWSGMSRTWLYSGALGMVAARPPEQLSELGDPFLVFGRFGITWRPLPRLDLSAQLDVHSSPYGASALDVLADPSIILGLGGSLQILENATLEIAVTEDDGMHRSAPDIGLHVALRWRL